MTGQDGTLRSCDPRLPEAVLYRAELHPVRVRRSARRPPVPKTGALLARASPWLLAFPRGVEPRTIRFVVGRSFQLSYGNMYWYRRRVPTPLPGRERPGS